MEFLEKLTDWFTAFTGGVERILTRLFGSSNERRIRNIGFVRKKDGSSHVTPASVLDRINALEPEMEKLSDGELKESASKFRARLAGGETLDDILPDAFAAVREAGKRHLKMRHYDVQMVGGYILHKGMIAEMVTGEGKTLVATLPAFLNALAMKVHVITVNDYLARRDMEWMGPLHMALGLTVGAIQSQMHPHERQKHYACDITYGTNNEFGFDYLRDNMKPTKQLQVQGPLDFAIVDEIDNILIDEARTPLIISGPAHDDVTKYAKADRIARQLTRDEHFEVKEKEHTCHLTEDGIRKGEELAGVESFYTAGNMEWPHLIDNSLKAHHLYKRDVNYVVKDGQVVIVDEFTGRLMSGRQWSDGLHQAVEAKEGVRIKAENQTLATITLQNYFKLYKKLAGMTGTAMTEAAEFWKVYKLDVVSVPTNKPLHRVNHPDVIFRSENEKWNSVVDEIREVHKSGRPILVGTVSIEESERVASKLDRHGIKHDVLNAKHHEREAEIIAQAGRMHGVTIATNMAGRGTDIILGGNPENAAWEQLKHTYESRLDIPKAEWEALTADIARREGMFDEGRKVAELGGLHVVGTQRHEARRIDLQLRGRAGRQGDPGTSRFFLSLEDELMRKFAGDWVKNMLTRLGMQEGEAIESRMVTRRIEAAQKKVEERNFDIRKNLLEYDEIMDEQRKQMYSFRQRILDGANCRDIILEMIEKQIGKGVGIFLDPDYRWETVTEWAKLELHIEINADHVRDMDREQLGYYLRDEARAQGEEQIAEQIDENLPADAEDKSEWSWQALSKWANTRFGLNTNDRELKKIDRDGVHDYLRDRAFEAIDRYDLSPLDHFLEEDFPQKQLCGWLQHQFTLQCTPEEFKNVEDESEAIERVLEKIREAYREKEILFPVAVGMTNCFSNQQTGGERDRREKLVHWANHRFGSTLDAEQLRGKSHQDIQNVLADASRRYFIEIDRLDQVDDYLDRAYGENGRDVHRNGQPGGNGHVENPDVLAELTGWAGRELHVNLQPSDLQELDRESARQRLLMEYDNRYRPELAHAERALLLDVIDTAWKDHLYYMDHLRSGIGLVGYAQKDPKVEYKREGRKASIQMWERIGQQVTGAIFRLERQSPEFVGSLWQITAVQHEAFNSSPGTTAVEMESGRADPGTDMRTIDPIVNRAPKVGRNDPCPCGSGKKYKKCHGANA